MAMTWASSCYQSHCCPQKKSGGSGAEKKIEFARITRVKQETNSMRVNCPTHPDGWLVLCRWPTSSLSSLVCTFYHLTLWWCRSLGFPCGCAAPLEQVWLKASSKPRAGSVSLRFTWLLLKTHARCTLTETAAGKPGSPLQRHVMMFWDSTKWLKPERRCVQLVGELRNTPISVANCRVKKKKLLQFSLRSSSALAVKIKSSMMCDSHSTTKILAATRSQCGKDGEQTVCWTVLRWSQRFSVIYEACWPVGCCWNTICCLLNASYAEGKDKACGCSIKTQGNSFLVMLVCRRNVAAN